MGKHFELTVWDRSHRLTSTLHRLARRLPPYELTGLGAELCAAAAAVPTQIAESVRAAELSARLRHLDEAQRRASETECLLLLLAELPYLTQDTVRMLAQESQRIQVLLDEHRGSVARGEYD